jgi:hypothetical protein
MDIKISKRDNIKFGLIFSFLFLFIGFFPLKNGGSIKIWSVFISFLLILIIFLKPSLFTFLNKIWLKFGILISKITSPIFMGLIFFTLVSFIGFLVKLFRIDILRLNKNQESYWIDKKEKLHSMRNQF